MGKVTHIEAEASKFPLLAVPPKPETFGVSMAMASGCAQRKVTSTSWSPVFTTILGVGNFWLAKSKKSLRAK